jgi:hypothetical protein
MKVLYVVLYTHAPATWVKFEQLTDTSVTACVYEFTRRPLNISRYRDFKLQRLILRHCNFT